MKFPAYQTFPELLDTGIRQVALVTTIIPKMDGVAAILLFSSVNRWAHRTYSWGTDGNGE